MAASIQARLQALSLQELLQEQLEAAQCVAAASQAISARLDEQAKLQLPRQLPTGRYNQPAGADGERWKRALRPALGLGEPLLGAGPSTGGGGCCWPASVSAGQVHRIELEPQGVPVLDARRLSGTHPSPGTLASLGARQAPGALASPGPHTKLNFSSEPGRPAAGEEPAATSPLNKRCESKERCKALFPDPEKVKDQVRQVMTDTSTYDVERLYHTTGIWQAVVRHAAFKNFTFVIIALNSLWIAVDTDYNTASSPEDAPWEFQVVDNLFCFFFVLEILARFKAFRKKCDALNDGWFRFDGVLVLLMAFNTWFVPLASSIGILSQKSSPLLQGTMFFRILRLFRLARVGRVARLLKGCPELMVLVKGMAFALRAVFSTLCLLMLVIYVFAVAFTETLAGTKAAKGCFETVGQSMNCLLLQGVFADQASIITQLLNEHWTYYAAILAYMVIGSMTLLNMLIGVMCEVMQMVSEAEKDALMQQGLKEKIGKVVKGVDTDHDMVITHEEFKKMLESPTAMQALAEQKIDVVQLVDFVDCIFQDKVGLGIDDFVETVLQFRNDNTATVKDLLDIRRTLLVEIEFLLVNNRG